MPKRLEKVTKKAIGRLKIKKKKSNATAEASEALPSDATSASFLGLPPEIRNHIYELLATDTALTVYPSKPKKPLTPVALLLACRQTRQEYKKLLLANAQLLISIREYHFNNLVRVLENVQPEDLEALKLNRNIWILLQLSHVPSGDDGKNLRGWVDYRRSDYRRPYFGPNGEAASHLVFEYDVRFSPSFRAPRSASRYADGYSMKLDLLRSHLRMYQGLENRLQSEVETQGGRPVCELEKLRRDIEECVRMYEDLQSQLPEPPLRSASVVTTASAMLATSTPGRG